ncbi:MAG: sugar ABC transporter ATP-binding protein [Nocardioidaceae bacterium]|nr:sugar ABC transporter ATP-binding protein [Nocardioidaceae bacterium]
MTSTQQDPTRTTEAALVLDGIDKRFGQVHAVKDVSLTINRHEVLGLIGENGAGKSTLLKILTGIYQPDAGSIEVNGTQVRFRRPQDSVAAGIGVVHQEQSLLTNLSVAENLAMTASGSRRAGTRLGFYRWGRINADAAATLDRVGASIDPRTIVGDLSFVDRQMVEIARAVQVDEMVGGTPLVILDEPTSVLERNETEILEREIRTLKEIGSVVFVSHRLDEVLRICDRIAVMRHGELVAERRTDEVTEDELFQLMVGRAAQATQRDDRAGGASQTPVVAVQGLTRRGSFEDVSFEVRSGRTVAIVGTMGSGRESVCRALFGAETWDGGTIELEGTSLSAWSTVKAVKAGVAYVPSERRVEGMVGGLSAAANLTLSHPGSTRRGPFLDPRARNRTAATWFERLDVRPSDPSLPLGSFSGGNQQKVVMAKWLMAEELKVLVLDHPLRGLDPGAKEIVNEQIRAACRDGVAVVLLPDTLEEALEMGDDILVMRDGEVTGRFDLSTEAPTSLDLLEKMV